MKARLSDKARALVDDARVVWLTTVRSDGQPQASPVWFVIDDGEFLIFSLADTARVKNIAANPRVALNLDSNEGSDVVTIEGTARVAEGPASHEVAGYVAKYQAEMRHMGYDPERFSADYPVAIRVRVDRVRED